MNMCAFVIADHRVLRTLLPIPLNPPFCKGGVMFDNANYPNAVSLGFHEIDRLLVLFSVLPIPLNPPFCKGGLVSPIYLGIPEREYLRRSQSQRYEIISRLFAEKRYLCNPFNPY